MKIPSCRRDSKAEMTPEAKRVRLTIRVPEDLWQRFRTLLLWRDHSSQTLNQEVVRLITRRCLEIASKLDDKSRATVPVGILAEYCETTRREILEEE